MDEREWQAERERREQEELEKARALLTEEQRDRLEYYCAEMHERDIYATKYEIAIANELRAARSEQDQAVEIKHILARAEREARERANREYSENDRQREQQAKLEAAEREQRAQRDAAFEEARRRAFEALEKPQVIDDAASADRQRRRADHYELLRQQPAEQEPTRKSESEWRKTAREVLESKPEQSDQDRNISDRQQEREKEAGQNRSNVPNKGFTRGGRMP